MNKMNKYIIILISFFLAQACYEEPDFWLDQNIKEGGTYYPVIQSLTISPSSGTGFKSGQSVEIALQYWSRDEVKELQYYQIVNGVETLLGSEPYQDSFDAESEAQLFKYTTTLPTADSGTQVTYKVSVVTVHELSKSTSRNVVIE